MGSPRGLLFGFYDTPNASIGFEFWEWGSENCFYVRMAHGTSAPNYGSIADTYPLNEWSQVAFTYQASTGHHRLYKNGVLHYYR